LAGAVAEEASDRRSNVLTATATRRSKSLEPGGINRLTVSESQRVFRDFHGIRAGARPLALHPPPS
jgi:hypothetical protein